MLDTEAPAKFGVSVANGEFFRELSVFDEMFLMRSVPRVERKPGIAGPFAALVDAIARDATRTPHVRSENTADRDSK